MPAFFSLSQGNPPTTNIPINIVRVLCSEGVDDFDDCRRSLTSETCTHDEDVQV